jgi:hypothetical protein
MRLAFILAEVLYVVNGLNWIIRLLVENRLFKWSQINKQIKQTNMS